MLGAIDHASPPTTTGRAATAEWRRMASGCTGEPLRSVPRMLLPSVATPRVNHRGFARGAGSARGQCSRDGLGMHSPPTPSPGAHNWLPKRPQRLMGLAHMHLRGQEPVESCNCHESAIPNRCCSPPMHHWLTPLPVSPPSQWPSRCRNEKQARNAHTPPPLAIATQRYQLNTVPTPTVAWTRP